MGQNRMDRIREGWKHLNNLKGHCNNRPDEEGHSSQSFAFNKERKRVLDMSELTLEAVEAKVYALYDLLRDWRPDEDTDEFMDEMEAALVWQRAGLHRFKDVD